jgi:hypothetical protein
MHIQEIKKERIEAQSETKDKVIKLKIESTNSEMRELLGIEDYFGEDPLSEVSDVKPEIKVEIKNEVEQNGFSKKRPGRARSKTKIHYFSANEDSDEDYDPKRKKLQGQVDIFPYQCKICKKSYISKIQLDKHLNAAHILERKFKCRICPRSFLTKQHRDQHHNNRHVASAKSHSCMFENCQKSFK